MSFDILRVKKEERASAQPKGSKTKYYPELLCSKCAAFTYHDITEAENKDRIIKCMECNIEHRLEWVSKTLGWVDKGFGNLGFLFVYFGSEELAKMVMKEKK